MADPRIKEKLDQICTMMEPILDDTAVPRNIRHTISECKARVMNGSDDQSVDVATAVYMLDEVANDINMPFHTRTEIWNIISALEKMKEELEK